MMIHLVLPLVVVLAACNGVLPPLCEQSCARYVDLGCGMEGLGEAQCVEACERYEEQGQLAPALSWHPDCQLQAETCEAWATCRGG